MTSALIVMPTLIVNRAIFCSGVITRYQVGPGPEREVDTAPRREALGGRGVIGPHVDDLPKVRGLGRHVASSGVRATQRGSFQSLVTLLIAPRGAESSPNDEFPRVELYPRELRSRPSYRAISPRTRVAETSELR